MKLSFLLSTSMLLICSVVQSPAQIIEIGNSSWTYSQNFNSLSSSNDDPLATWTNNSTLPGWYGFGHNAAEKTTIFSSNGTQGVIVGGSANTINMVQSIGTGSDRALGMWATGNSGIQYYLIYLQNISGGTINNLSISYDALKLENSASNTPLELFYRVSATSLTVNATLVMSDTGWTEISSMDYKPGTGADSSERSFTFSNLNLVDDGYMMFRFKLVNSSAVLGIDNLKMDLVPEPQTAVLFGLGMMVWMLRTQTRKLQNS